MLPAGDQDEVELPTMLPAGDRDEVEMVPPHPGPISTSSRSPAGSIVGTLYHKL